MTIDLLALEDQLTDRERAWRDEVRDLVDRAVRPHAAQWFADATFPHDLVPELGRAGLLGAHLSGYGCAGRTAVEYGLAAMELEAGDSGVRTLVSVQGSLAMTAIARYGTEAQRERWLPPMAAGETLGCFGLTEPGAGSDPGGMTTTATRTADGGWSISGAKRWIGLASLAEVAVIWARTEEGVRGFLVPTATEGFAATPIEPKLSMRASVQCDIALRDVRLPPDAVLPGARGLGAALRCLNEARYGIVWGVMGAARDAAEVALAHAQERRQFGSPIAAFQLTQQKLVDMQLELEKGVLLALHLGRRKDAGLLTTEQVSFGKLNNVREAIEICRQARTILGGDGLTAERSPLRHALNLESVRTYEGTDEVHTLVLGQAITGIGAFRLG
ncbi:MAG: acyl-CoA dehydrogenase family protein [Amnibacterium sp.]